MALVHTRGQLILVGGGQAKDIGAEAEVESVFSLDLVKAYQDSVETQADEGMDQRGALWSGGTFNLPTPRLWSSLAIEAEHIHPHQKLLAEYRRLRCDDRDP
jgi:hypothetical protein